MTSIDQQIQEMKQKLKPYGTEITIHNFQIKNNYREKFSESKGLTFSIFRKLQINKPKNQKTIEDNSEIEKITNFQWAGYVEE